MEDEKISPLNILVVDDDALNKEILKVLLTQWGHKVDFAGNGIEAIDCMKASQFDIVFMDLQMPFMDGVEASQKIREWENGGRRTFIVALTASFLPEDGRKLFDAGIDNYIEKPFNVAHIRRMLNYKAAVLKRIENPDQTLPFEEISINDILDIPMGIRQVGSSHETYWSLLNEFSTDLPGRMNTLQDAVARRDLGTLSRAAHNLKGVSANLGALQLSEYAKRLERVSGEGYTDGVPKLVDEIRSAGDRLQRVAGLLLSGRRLDNHV